MAIREKNDRMGGTNSNMTSYVFCKHWYLMYWYYTNLLQTVLAKTRILMQTSEGKGLSAFTPLQMQTIGTTGTPAHSAHPLACPWVHLEL